MIDPTDDDEDGCMCEFPPTCDGYGVVHCDGCGGDFCVCAECHGAGIVECDGCEMCRDLDDYDAEAA